MFCSSYQLGCTVAAISAQRTVEHFKKALQNITTDRTPHSVVVAERHATKRRTPRRRKWNTAAANETFSLPFTFFQFSVLRGGSTAAALYFLHNMVPDFISDNDTTLPDQKKPQLVNVCPWSHRSTVESRTIHFQIQCFPLNVTPDIVPKGLMWQFSNWHRDPHVLEIVG